MPSRPKIKGKLTPRFIPWNRKSCWLCGKMAYKDWERLGWCYDHQPFNPRFEIKKPVRSTVLLRADQEPRWAHFPTSKLEGTSMADREKHQRKVEARLGRKKRKPARSKKVSRDRAYVR